MKKMKNKGYKVGGKLPMVKGPDGKMVPEFAADGKGKMAKGGTIRKMKKGMKVKGYAAGGLKDVPEDNKGLGKLPQKVRNNMGFKAKGGTIKKMAKGGTIRKMKGGKMVTKGGTKGGAKGGKAKVRGAGIAQRGVRPAKMR